MRPAIILQSGLSCGLLYALAEKGVIIREKAFHNLESFELQKNGAKKAECMSGLPFFVRGDVVGGFPEISNTQFSKFLKQVTSHISLQPKVFVQDGTIGTCSKCDVKIRIISDSPTAVLTLSGFLPKVHSRAVSHDPCPLTVYVAASISPSIGNIVGLVSSSSSAGYLAADIERSSLILCGKSFADACGVRYLLAALAAPVISARRGLPLGARILTLGGSTILLFALEDAVQRFCNSKEILISDAGVILSSDGASPFFSTANLAKTTVQKPISVVFLVSDSSGVIPTISKLSAGQAAYQFLAGYHDGKFLPTFWSGPSPILSVELASALLGYLKGNQIQSFLVNCNHGGENMEGDHLLKLVNAALYESRSVSFFSAPANQKVQDLKGKYKRFLSGKFGNLPERFSF